MRIVQVANFVHPTSGGLGTAMSALRERYVAMGHEVFEILPRWGERSFDNAHDHRLVVPSVRLPFSGGYRVIARREELRGMLEELNPDVVEVNDKSTLAWVPGWCHSRGIRSIVISHERSDLVQDRVGFLGRPVDAYLARARALLVETSEAIICASRYAAAEFGEGTKKVHVVPFGVDHRIFRPIDPPRDWADPLTVVVCSRLSQEKNVDIAISGFVELARRTPARLRVLGDGPMRVSLENLTRGTDAEFLGHVNGRERVARELANADVVVNMGPAETFGLATLEALSSGTPVVVARTGASPEIVDESVGRAATASATGVASAIEELTMTSRVDLSRNAIERARIFDWATTAEIILGSLFEGHEDHAAVA